MRAFLVPLIAAVGLGFGPHAGAAESGFYVGVDLGVARPDVASSDGFLILINPFQAFFQALPESTNAESTVLAGGPILGYRINRYVAAELAYTRFGSIDIAETYRIDLGPFIPGATLDFRQDMQAQIAGPSVHLLGILPIAQGFEAFARGGILFADQDVRVDVIGDLSDTVAEELWVFGLGLDVAIVSRWKARFAVEVVDEMRPTDHSGAIALRRFMLGLTYDF